MSLETLLDTWKRSPLKSSRLLLVLALADAADDEGWSSPKVDWLAERARVQPRQAQRILRDLEAAGTLEVRQGVGRGRTSAYRLRLEKGVIHATFSSEKGGAEDTLSPGKGGVHVAHFPEKGDTQDAFSPGKGGTDDTFSPPSDSPLTPTQPDDHHPDRRLTAQQETVRRAQEIYASVGASPPDPGVIRLWANTLGGPDPLCQLLADLAGAGHLASKSQGYVWKAVQNRVRGSSRESSRPAAGTTGRTSLSPSPPAGGKGSGRGGTGSTGSVGVDARRRQQAAALARGGRAS
ncbi:MAG TPA: hypothetical protein VN493_30900 [Thermoanaerobaculia bacterium]|nr:hypothetical protein [Thermoanaerobaculia bacterium]